VRQLLKRVLRRCCQLHAHPRRINSVSRNQQTWKIANIERFRHREKINIAASSLAQTTNFAGSYLHLTSNNSRRNSRRNSNNMGDSYHQLLISIAGNHLRPKTSIVDSHRLQMTSFAGRKQAQTLHRHMNIFGKALKEQIPMTHIQRTA
jgi:hypothetical protein